MAGARIFLSAREGKAETYMGEAPPLAREGGTYVVLIPQIGISIVSWLQLVLSMNRYRGVSKCHRIDLWSLVLFLHAGFVRWIARLALVSQAAEIQMAAALTASAIAWVAFVLVFNDGFHLPSRQQWIALLMTLLVTLLWEVHNRMLVQLPRPR
jgi:hypothetical protein